MNECLWSLFDLIQDGLVDLGEAPDRYRQILGKPDLSNVDLMLRLGNFGLPDHHIQNADIGTEEKELIAEITKLVELYIVGGFQLTEVIALIKETLIGLSMDIQLLSVLITDKSRDVASISKSIWEEAAREKNKETSAQSVSDEFGMICDDVLNASLTAEDSLAMLSPSIGKGKLTGAQKSHTLSKIHPSQVEVYRRLFESKTNRVDGLERSLTAIGMPIRTVETESMLPSTYTRLEEGSTSHLSKDTANAITEARSSNVAQLDILDDLSGILPTTNTVGHLSRKPLASCGASTVIMPPPAYCKPLTQPSKKPRDMSRLLMERPGTPTLKPVQVIPASPKLDQPKLTKGVWRPYVSDNDIYDYGYLSTSPERGTTFDMFGLALPTRKVRDIGPEIGLPSNYIQKQIHSRTARRVKTKKFLKASINVTFLLGNAKLPT